MDTTRRVPLLITLREDLAAFVERCAESPEIGSVDEFFDIAVEVLQMRLDATLRYVEAQETQGLSEEDMMRAADRAITIRERDH